MAITTVTDVFNPETLVEAVQGEFAQKNAFMESLLVRSGALLVEGSMPEGGRDAIGKSVTVPYFGTLGEFADNPDGSAATPNKIQQTSENSLVTRDSLAFAVSRWAQGNAAVNPNVGDPYEESARQIKSAAIRAMDARTITAMKAAGVYLKDVYSSSVPKTLDWDLVVDAKADGWGDEMSDIVGMLIHSHTHKDLMKMKDGTGRPLWVKQVDSSFAEGGPVETWCGVPLIVSDRVPLDSSTMGAVTSSGTSPPVATLAGTPLGPWKLVIDCLLSHASDSSIRFSLDGGNIWSDPIAVTDAGTPFALIDPAIDSRVGVNGKSGITVSFAAGTFNADNLWTATASLKVMSMLLKRGAAAFWYNQNALAMKTDENILDDTDLAAMHLYSVAHRYRRARGGTKPGVVQITHNVSGY